MGYTHYWDRPKVQISKNVWGRFIEDVQKIIDARIDILCFESHAPDTPPICSLDFIQLNGKGNEGHETFTLYRRPGSDWQFCKTAAKPYDAVVTAILALAKHHLGNRITVSSDGNEKHWTEGLQLVSDVLGIEIPFPC
jgi:hypothetical protein